MLNYATKTVYTYEGESGSLLLLANISIDRPKGI